MLSCYQPSCDCALLGVPCCILVHDCVLTASAPCRSPLGSEAAVNWVHCKDIGAVCAALLVRDPDAAAAGKAVEVVEVTGPAGSTMTAVAMAELLTNELGRPIRYEQVPVPVRRPKRCRLRA